MIIGYARVSTEGQTLEAQQASLSGAGAEKVFAEKVSGAVTDRKALARAISSLGAGDVLLVTRLDRLARSTRDLLNVLDAVSKAGGGISPSRGCLGRHHQSPRQIDGHDPRRPRGVRKGAHQGPHSRRAQPSSSPGNSLWPQTKAVGAPTTPGTSAEGGWRSVG
jgi:hypothetical protein